MQGFRGYVYCAIVVRDPHPTEKNMKKGTCPKPASPLAADRILGLDRSVLPVRWPRPSLSSPTPPSFRLPLQAQPHLARSRLAGRSARGDCTCTVPAYGAPADVYRRCRLNRRAAGMLARAARRGGYEGGGGGQGRHISWFWSGYLRPARAACAYERSQGPGTGRGVMRSARWRRGVLRWREAFCTSLDGGGFSAGSLLLRRVRHRSTRGARSAAWWSMAEPDGFGKQSRGEECGAAPRLWITRLRPRMIENVS
jgi:hypothetical protein